MVRGKRFRKSPLRHTVNASPYAMVGGTRFEHFTALPTDIQEKVVSKLTLRDAAALAVAGRAVRNVAGERVRDASDKIVGNIAKHIAAVMLTPAGTTGWAAEDTQLHVNVAGTWLTVRQAFRVGPQSPIQSTIYAPGAVTLATIGTEPLLSRTPGSLRPTRGRLWWAAVYNHRNERMSGFAKIASMALDRAYELADAESRARGTGQLGYVKVRLEYRALSTARKAPQRSPPTVLEVRPRRMPRKQRTPRAAPT